MCDPAYSALLCLYDCVLHSGHMKETVCEKEEREKKKHTHFYRTSLSLSLNSKFKERGEIKGEWSDGLWRWRLTLPRR